APRNVEVEGASGRSRKPIRIENVVPANLALHRDQRLDDVVGDHLLIGVRAIEHDVDGKAGGMPGPVAAKRADTPTEFRNDTLKRADHLGGGGTNGAGGMVGHVDLVLSGNDLEVAWRPEQAPWP